MQRSGHPSGCRAKFCVTQGWVGGQLPDPMWMAGAEDDEYERVGGVWLHARMGLGVHFFAPQERGWAKR